jgi:acylphosphatase
MGEDDPMLDKTDLSNAGTVGFQDRRIEKMDGTQAALLARQVQDEISKASGPKQILDIILSFGSTISKILGPLMLIFCLMGCMGGARPPAVMQAGAFKQATFNQAIADWKTRADANVRAINERGNAKITETFERNLNKAKNVKVETDGTVNVVVVTPDGQELKRPIDQFIRDVIELRDSEIAKLESIKAEERAEDAKIAEKFAAVAAMNELELRYFEKVETGTLTPDVASEFVKEFSEIITPLLGGNQGTGTPKR